MDARDRLQETSGVGMSRIAEEIVDGRVFDDASGVHDYDVVDEVSYNAEVVTDVHERDVPQFP